MCLEERAKRGAIEAAWSRRGGSARERERGWEKWKRDCRYTSGGWQGSKVEGLGKKERGTGG